MPDIDRMRRALVSVALAGTVAGGALSPANSYLDRFAPFSGSVWDAATTEAPDRIESPHGEASVSYDDYGVPHIDASTEPALYFAVGYAQAADRLFQLDLLRRVMRGQLSAVVGDATLESDRFHVAMDFVGAAEATWDHLRDTEVGPLLAAYAEGVNACMSQGPLPVEFSLLEYEPAPWTPVDSMLMEKQISWGLTGSFEPLRRATRRESLGRETDAELFPTRKDHDVPILGDAQVAGSEETDGLAADFGPVLSWVQEFEPATGVGSNSWVVSGEHTESGLPIVANDPHLDLQAPPVWYQQHLSGPDYGVRGVTFPGVPFVIIGENDHGAWGFTNVGADVIDHYQYETDGDRYRYGEEWRRFETTSRTIEVAGAPDESVEVRKTVHGPVLSREGIEVGVAWTGLTATETTLAVYRMGKSTGLSDFEAATRLFDLPTQNVVYADRAGNTYYHVTGRIPIRTAEGSEIPGNRIFDGSAPEGEWDGFTPFGTATWDGFVPFEEKPGAVNPDVLATANQRVVDDPAHYIGSEYAPPFRGRRIYDRLRGAIETGPVTPATMRRIQRDTVDYRAAMLVPELRSVRAELSSEAADLLARLEGWEYSMSVDSRGALVFDEVFEAYKAALFEAGFEAAGLDEADLPGDWVAITIDPASDWFERPEPPSSKRAAMVEGLETAAESLAASSDRVYGDRNVVTIDHPFDQAFLNYPEMPTGGSGATVMNYRRDSNVGSSWRMVSPMEGDSSVILPGGNSGQPFDEHYDDQLARWAEGRYLPFDRDPGPEPDLQFVPEGTE